MSISMSVTSRSLDFQRTDCAAAGDAAHVAREGRELIMSTLRAKWLGAPPAAISLGLCIVIELMREKADAGDEISYQRAVTMVTRAACTAILHRPRNERDLTATLRRILAAARRERHAA